MFSGKVDSIFHLARAIRFIQDQLSNRMLCKLSPVSVPSIECKAEPAKQEFGASIRSKHLMIYLR